MHLNRRVFTTSLLAAPFLGTPAFAKLSLSDISAYVNDIKSVTANFTQINSKGQQATGKIYIKRPGRMRFEYDPPNGALVVAGNGRLTITDPKSKSATKVYPLRKTPLNIILERKVDFSKDALVQGHEARGEFTHLTLRDPKQPRMGTAELIFSNGPVSLRQWVITDPQNRETTLLLSNIQNAPKLSNKLFRIEPKEREN